MKAAEPGRGRPTPAGVVGLAIFFALAACMALVAAISLATPGGPLEPIWRINPRGHAAFASMGGAAPALLTLLAAACALTALGLVRRARWARLLAMGILAANGLGDAIALATGDRRAALALLIVGALVAYLASKGVRQHFAPPPPIPD